MASHALAYSNGLFPELNSLAASASRSDVTPLAALGLLVICAVALLTSSPTVVASYKPIDRADRVDDWLYQPELMYALMLLYFIAAGAGPVSVDQLLKLWIG